MPEEGYNPVSLNEPKQQVEGTERAGRIEWAGSIERTEVEVTVMVRARRKVSALFPFFSATLYLLDVASSICFAVFLFVHANDLGVGMYKFPYNLWGAFIIAITYVSSFIINIIATFDRHDTRERTVLGIFLKLLLCFLPHFYVLKACWIHLMGTLKGGLRVEAVEWTSFTRILQGLVDSVPQMILQAYIVSFETLRRDTTYYPTWVAVTSLTISAINATFGLTFYLVTKYYGVEGRRPAVWQRILLALAGLFTLGGRALAVGFMGSGWDMLWLALLGLIMIFLLVFIYWTYRVRKRASGPFYELKLRFAISLIATFAVAVPLKWTFIVSLPYLGLSAAFVAQRHEETLEWVMFAVPLASQLLGLVLVLACRSIYWKSYAVLVKVVLPEQQEAIEPK